MMKYGWTWPISKQFTFKHVYKYVMTESTTALTLAARLAQKLKDFKGGLDVIF